MIGSREQLLHLLAEAAEIEHTLMCSYLYAAFSLKRGSEDGLASHEGEAVERWRKAIMDVAIEEMGHLLMVANLMVAVGGRPHFVRPNFPVSAGYFPSGVVVRLSGFSEDTLKHFIFLERPRGVEEDDSTEYNQETYDRKQAHPALMPSALDYATISHLYDAIRENLDALAERLGEDSLFIGARLSQLGPDLVNLEGLAVIDGLAAARQTIDVIVEQGEGSPADREESHYRRFLAIQKEYDALARVRPAFSPAWPVADNPVLRRPPETSSEVFIDDPEAGPLLDFACATYGLLLRILVQSFARVGATAKADQDVLLSAAFELMHVLGAAGEALARLPGSPAVPGVNAGMSFTMLRSIEPLLSGVEARIIREQLEALAQVASASRAMSQTASSKLKTLAAEFRLGAE